tara:strand:+ start:3107 stop:4099 length:993 start_codon:yes stop_codon:yes gene_type:complete
MANTIGWGKATQNNDNGFGKYQNTIGAASIYAESYAGETAIVGTSAAFSYSASSYNQGEADPTPTITGTAGGSFNASAGLVFVDTGTFNSSTGQIDLSASTIDSHIITYTVDGVQSGQTVGVTAVPYQSTRSFSFDGLNDYFDLGNPTDLQLTSAFSISLWINYDNTPGPFYGIDGILGNSNTAGNNGFRVLMFNAKLYFYVNNTLTQYDLSSGSTIPAIVAGDWHHFCFTYDGTNTAIFIDNTSVATGTASPAAYASTNFNIAKAQYGFTGYYFAGNIDEVSLWDSALSSDAVTEIFNEQPSGSGKPNSLTSLTNASSSNLVAWYKMGE